MFGFLIREQCSVEPNAYTVTYGDSSGMQHSETFVLDLFPCSTSTEITAAPTTDFARSCVVLFRRLHRDPLAPPAPLKVQLSTPPIEIISQTQQP
jgi:hypothetical protein